MATKTRKQIYIECCFPRSQNVEELNMSEEFISVNVLKNRIQEKRKSNDMWRKEADELFNELEEELEGK